MADIRRSGASAESLPFDWVVTVGRPRLGVVEIWTSAGDGERMGFSFGERANEGVDERESMREKAITNLESRFGITDF